MDVKSVSLNNSYNLKIDCGTDYTISNAIAFGGTTKTSYFVENESICRLFITKINLYTDYCSMLYDFEKLLVDNKCVGKNNCNLIFDVSKIKKGCILDSSVKNLYLAYSCYGNNFLFIN